MHLKIEKSLTFPLPFFYTITRVTFSSSKFSRALNPDLERWYAGHFTGRFKDLKGDRGKMSFRAVDIYRVQKRQIFDNWHLEDNLSLMQQLGVVKP